MSEKAIKISRKEASRLLKVSIRTVDRYLKDGKLTTIQEDGRVFLDRREVRDFKRSRDVDISTSEVDMSTGGMSIDNEVDNAVDNVEVLSIDEVDMSISEQEKKSTRKQEESVYKTLYLEAKEEITEKNDRLELANYRIGQLEAQVKNSIPLLEYRRETAEKERENENFIRRVTNQLRKETFSKRVFLVLLLTILALQPLWLLLFYR